MNIARTWLPCVAGLILLSGCATDGDMVRNKKPQAGTLEQALTEAGVRHTLEFYPAQHGFAVPDNPTHDPSAEDRHWKALKELYGSALPG